MSLNVLYIPRYESKHLVSSRDVQTLMGNKWMEKMAIKWKWMGNGHCPLMDSRALEMVNICPLYHRADINGGKYVLKVFYAWLACLFGNKLLYFW